MICSWWVVSVHTLCLFISSTSESHLQMDQISVRNGDMVKHIADVEGHTVLLKGQLEECERKWNKAHAENVRLHQQVSSLHARLQVYIKFLFLLLGLSTAWAVYNKTDAGNPQGLLA